MGALLEAIRIQVKINAINFLSLQAVSDNTE